MLGSTWDLGRIRVPGAGAVVGLALWFAGCQASPSAPMPDGQFGAAAGGVAGELAATGGVIGDPGPPSPSGGPTTGGAVGIAGGFAGGELSCVTPAPPTGAVFEAERVLSSAPARAELYSWVTDEEATTLRTEEQLFRPLTQPSFNGMTLRAVAARSDPAIAELASLLSGKQFASGRIAWPEPWAIRTAIDGSDPGHNLLRMVLKPEAWVVVLSDGNLRVVDQQNQPVAVADALATPSRIGAIYHEHDMSDGGPDCSRPPTAELGYREFVVTNLAMISEWSLGTELIRDRLRANITDLTEFFNRTRACPTEVSAEFWNQDVVCSWGVDPSGNMGEQVAYQEALAMPNDQYATDPRPLGALIDRLQGDLFEPDPFVVTPGSP